MPLPDERPRQSVANLIGRFEKQKSTSAPAPPPAFQRTSSVASHHTGDSAVEELREKREWPPKRVDAPSTTVSPPMPNPGTVEPSSVPSPSDKEPLSVKNSPTSDPPAEVAPIPLLPTDLTPSSMPPPTKVSPSTPTKSATPRPLAPNKPSTLKPMIKSTHETPQKPAASASATPLKPQHSGQSASSTRTPAIKTSTATKFSAVITPARTKTPIIRAKSPPSTIRPKTPSSGLYAPTAASLARSKNAPAPPIVEKSKRRITTDLSKPTAASASKVRTPAATPPKASKPSIAKPGPPKPAIGVGKSTAKQVTAKPTTSKAVAAKASAATRVKNGSIADANPIGATTITGSSHDTNQAVAVPEGPAQDATNHHEVTEEVIEEHVPDAEKNQVESYDDDFPEGNDIGHDEPVIETHGDHDVFGDNPTVADEVHDTPHTKQPEENVANSGKGFDANGVIVPEVSIVENTLMDEDKSPTHFDNHLEEDTIHAKIISRPVGTDLEDIVNMLESVPQVHRPDLETTTGAPRSISDTGEIPDEY